MWLDYYEQVDTLDPLTIMLMNEDDEDTEIDVLESEHRASLHRTAPKQSDYEPSITRSRFSD